MLGLIRFSLSVLVVRSHIWPTGQPWIAWQSVFAFYALSGYLMTLILNEVYGFSYKGAKAFLLNRIFRLAPAYYITIGLAFFFSLFVFPLNNLNDALKIPTNFYEILTNIILIGQVSFDNSSMVTSRLSPSAWSLSIELFCYILFAIGFAKSPRRLIVLLIMGFIMQVVSHFLAKYHIIHQTWEYGEFQFQNYYGVLHAGFIPFSLGGLGYFYREKIRFFLQDRKSLLFINLLLMLLLSWFWDFMQFVLGQFLMALLMAMIVPIVINRSSAGLLKRIDKLLGDLSYPIFISHWVIASIIAGLFSALSARSFSLFMATLIVTILFSLPIIKLEQHINKIRAALRQRILHKSPCLELGENS